MLNRKAVGKVSEAVRNHRAKSFRRRPTHRNHVAYTLTNPESQHTKIPTDFPKCGTEIIFPRPKQPTPGPPHRPSNSRNPYARSPTPLVEQQKPLRQVQAPHILQGTSNSRTTSRSVPPWSGCSTWMVHLPWRMIANSCPFPTPGPPHRKARRTAAPRRDPSTRRAALAMVEHRALEHRFPHRRPLPRHQPRSSSPRRCCAPPRPPRAGEEVACRPGCCSADTPGSAAGNYFRERRGSGQQRSFLVDLRRAGGTTKTHLELRRSQGPTSRPGGDCGQERVEEEDTGPCVATHRADADS